MKGKKLIMAIKPNEVPNWANVIERDDEGNIIGYGTDADYDTHAADVMNGNGYYDNDGHYRSFQNYDNN